MNKSFLIVLILCLAVCLGLAACSHTSKQTPQPEPEVEATAEPETEPSGAPELNGKLEENMVLVVFDGEDRARLAGLTVWAADGAEFDPVVSEATEEPAFGIYRLPAGEYFFSFREENGLSLENVAFAIGEGVDEALVTLEETPDVFAVETGSGVFVNPVYQNVISEETLSELNQEQKSVEDIAKALMEFRDTVRAADD